MNGGNVRVFWSGVSNRTHLIYGAAWLRRELAATSGQVSLVLMPPRSFLSSSPPTLEQAAGYLPASPRLRVTTIDTAGDEIGPGETAHLLGVGGVGPRPWLRLHRANPGRRLRVAMTDEGLSTYGTWLTRRAAYVREATPGPVATARAAVGAAATAALASSRFLLHRHRHGRWQLNAHIAAEFRRHQARQLPTTTAVLLSQPWPELGVVDEARYLGHIDRLATSAAQAGWQLRVHPHPAEPSRRYAELALAGDDLAEANAECVNAGLVIGTSSTAMLNLASIHSIPAMRLELPELRSLDQRLGRRQRSLLDHYLGPAMPPATWSQVLRGKVGS
ncbi:MAG: hypothetical protein ACK5KO_13560 [Arachnia sp.]